MFRPALIAALVAAALFAAPAVPLAAVDRPAPLRLAGTTDLPDYTGDFDHFAIDTRDSRLFLAGEEHAELEVFDLATGAIVRRIPGFGTPHSLWYTAATNELLVIDGDKPSPVLDAQSLAVKRSYDLAKGADSIGWDPVARHLWVVSGGKDVPQKDSNLTELDPATGKTLRNVHFDADHVEAMAISTRSPNLFISVTDKNTIAVVDRRRGQIVHQWPIHEAEQNAPLAFDEARNRLFVVTRKPGKTLVINALTGATVAAFEAPARTDQVIWDAANRRVYVTGGQGYISVIEQDDANHYREAARIPSLPGAKTAILDSVHHRLWVAASPGESGAMGRLMWFDVAPRKAVR